MATIPDYYAVEYRGVLVDPYRIAQLYGITNQPQFHALKKLLRNGEDIKGWIDDMKGARDALSRLIEMEEEDREA